MDTLSTAQAYKLRDAFVDGVKHYVQSLAWRAMDDRELRGATWKQVANLAGLQDVSTIHKWRRGETNLNNTIETVLCLCEHHGSLEVATSVVQGFRGTNAIELYDAGFARALLKFRKLSPGLGRKNADLQSAQTAIRELRPVFRWTDWVVDRVERRDKSLVKIHRFLKENKITTLDFHSLDELEKEWGPAWIRVRDALSLERIREQTNDYT